MLTWVLATACALLAVSTIVLLIRQRRLAMGAEKSAGFREPRRIERDPAAPLERMDLGVVVLNESLAPVSANAAARRLLRLPES
jgi:hypothetical protein